LDDVFGALDRRGGNFFGSDVATTYSGCAFLGLVPAGCNRIKDTLVSFFDVVFVEGESELILAGWDGVFGCRY